MKQFLLTLAIFIGFSFHSKAQDLVSPTNNGKDSNEILEVVEKMPEFSGGIQSLMNYLATNIKYPPIAAQNGIGGRLLVSFVIDKDGSIDISQTKCSNNPWKELEEEAQNTLATSEDEDEIKKARTILQAIKELRSEGMRVVNTMPRWKAGEHRGKKVRVKYTLPITYRLK